MNRTGTSAVPSSQLGYNGSALEQPMCPACRFGRLHPYVVTFAFPLAVTGIHLTSQGIESLEGWVAVCVGNNSYLRALREAGEDPDSPLVEACGFSMPLTAKPSRYQ